MGLPQPYATEINDVHVVTQETQGEVMLYLGAVHLRGPVPAKLIQGFNHRKTRQANAVLGGAVAPPECLTFDEVTEIVEMGPLLVRGVLGQLAIVRSDKGELQVPQVLIDLGQRQEVRWGGDGLGHEHPLLDRIIRSWGGLLVQTEIRGLEVQSEQVLSPGEVQGTGLRGETGALLQEIRDIVSGKGLVLQGIGHGAGEDRKSTR